uniref:alpha/beta hydrolase n=1 Tax=Altererythrobacter segetis TaxID=1104773 RepID=UPI001A9C2926|nr:alpha/beta hydrolase [Altererythrobacter segetis]
MAGVALAAACAAQAQSGRAPLPVAEDGTVEVPAMSAPVSEFLSPEARAYVVEHLLAVAKLDPSAPPSPVPPLIAPYIPRMKARYHTHREDAVIAGVKAYVYTPAGGIAAKNRKRVLINLHGGGFRECFPGCAELESIPIAALMRIKVVSLDYRQGPEYRFPAASEDVAAVYRQLLKTYRPEDIGIYGCSAGGILTGMSLAWFQKQGLPRPGAAGIFCAGGTLASAGFGGDATYTALPLGEARMPPPPAPPGAKALAPPLGYLTGADPTDPLVAPASSPAVLAKFPPTLIITGTRGFEYSSAIYTHEALVKAGVDAELHVWEGLFHGFYYNPDVPESRDAFDVMVRFFDRHLGK